MGQEQSVEGLHIDEFKVHAINEEKSPLSVSEESSFLVGRHSWCKCAIEWKTTNQSSNDQWASHSIRIYF